MEWQAEVRPGTVWPEYGDVRAFVDIVYGVHCTGPIGFEGTCVHDTGPVGCEGTLVYTVQDT